MKLTDYIIHILGGWAQEDLYYLETNCLTCEHINSNRIDPEQKELKNNGMSREISSPAALKGISRVAYIGHLGDEITAYSVRTDKKTDNTIESKNKNVVKDKKKVRPLKQSRKRQ